MEENAAQRHKIAIHVISKVEGGAGMKPKELEIPINLAKSQPSVIDDVTVFKSSHGMYALVQPYINITRKGNRCKL